MDEKKFDPYETISDERPMHQNQRDTLGAHIDAIGEETADASLETIGGQEEQPKREMIWLKPQITMNEQFRGVHKDNLKKYKSRAKPGDKENDYKLRLTQALLEKGMVKPGMIMVEIEKDDPEGIDYVLLAKAIYIVNEYNLDGGKRLKQAGPNTQSGKTVK